MEMLAIGLLAAFAAGYFLLAGTDLGTGMLLFFLGRDARERRLVIAAIAPFFLGNEIWLVAVVGLLAGLFPALEGALFPGLYWALGVLLAGWVVRDAGLWLRGRIAADRWRLFFDGAITAGSWAVTGAWGWVAGVLLLNGADVESTPLALLGTLAAWVLFALHGAAFAGLKLHGAPHGRARALAGPAGEAAAFTATCVLILAVPVAAAARLPLRDSVASSADALIVLAAVLLPLLVAVQAWVWWTFRDRVDKPSYL